MKVLLAKSAGFCYGVKRAVELAAKTGEETGGCWMLGDLIHNSHVVEDLARRGVRKTEDPAGLAAGDTVVIRSHGELKSVLDDLEARETRDGVPYGDWLRADFLQGCEGDIIDYDAVEQTIWQAAEEFDLACLGLDPAMSWTLSQRLMQSTAEHEAIQVVEIRQNMTGMSPATKQLELLLRKGMMLHEHNTAARWCFGNVRCATDGNENMKPMKNRSVGRIDIAVAWIIAMAAAMLCDTEKPDLAAALGRADFTL